MNGSLWLSEILKKSVPQNGLFFEKCGHHFIRHGGFTTFLVVTCGKRYLKKSLINEWYYEKQMKIDKVSFGLVCVSNS